MPASAPLPRCISRLIVAACIAPAVAGCASTPSPGAAPAAVSDAEKLAWILRLEDQRLVRDPSLPPAAAPDAEGGREGAASEAGVPRAPVPDLVRLAADAAAAVRYRAALALGRVGLPEAGPPLVAALADPEPDVRAIAAFGLGLLGDPSSADPLAAALEDPSPLVQARAADALGRLPAPGAAEAVGAMAAAHVTVAYDVDPDEPGYRLAPRVEAFRSGVRALAALGDFDALAATVLTGSGDPLLWWWPVADALARVGDSRAAGPLGTLAGVGGTSGVGLAARGLGELGGAPAVAALVDLLDPDRRDPRVVLAAVQALGAVGAAGAAPALRDLLRTPDIDANLLIAVVDALAAAGAPETAEIAIELLGHRAPAVRGAALTTLARLDPDTFLLLLSGLPPDPHWQVRADLARALALVDPDVAAYRLSLLLGDEDRRVVPGVLRALAAVRAPGMVDVLLAHLDDENAAVREAAAGLLGDAGDRRAVEFLAGAYRDELNAGSPAARAATVDALARIGGGPAVEALREALDDPDWAVRVRAAEGLAGRGGPDDPAAAIRSVPLPGLEPYDSPELLRPTVSPHVYLDTDRGTIQIELAVNEAPLTCTHFMRLARSGFYDGVTVGEVAAGQVVHAGDPRARVQGGPGYRIRDELSPLPFLRGTVGMALEGPDTGDGRFFITMAPQPLLDGRRPVFGTVIGGMDVVDRLQRGDVIHAVRVWDGRTPFQESSRRRSSRRDPEAAGS